MWEIKPWLHRADTAILLVTITAHLDRTLWVRRGADGLRNVPRSVPQVLRITPDILGNVQKQPLTFALSPLAWHKSASEPEGQPLPSADLLAVALSFLSHFLQSRAESLADQDETEEDVFCLGRFPFCGEWLAALKNGAESLILKGGGQSEVAQSCPALCDPTNYSLPGSSIHETFQTRVLKWVAISFSRASSQPRDRTWVSLIVGRRFYRLSHQGSPSERS